MVMLSYCLVPMLMLLVSLVGGTQKKGVCVPMGKYHCNDTQVLSNVSWWYDYGTGYKDQGCPTRGEFVPMVLGYWYWLKPVTFPSASKYLMVFSDTNIRDRFNMTPQTAASYWQKIQATVHGVKLVSPAPARCDKVEGECTMEHLKWLDEFFTACHNCTIDYVAVHTFMCDVEGDMHFLEQVHARYKKPVWLTMFACPHATSVTQIENYMKGLVPRLERAPFVFRYSWYQARIDHGYDYIANTFNSLLEPDSSKLTALGRLYNSLHG